MVSSKEAEGLTESSRGRSFITEVIETAWNNLLLRCYWSSVTVRVYSYLRGPPSQLLSSPRRTASALPVCLTPPE